jgi:uncharacterized protein
MSFMNYPGSFIWYELLTSDVDAARRFYGDVVGWNAKAHAVVPGYYLFTSVDSDIAGLMALDAGIARPLWLGYISVEDVDATVAGAVADGATLCVPPTDIPDVGRFAMILDAQRVAIYVMRMQGAGVSRSFAAQVGHCQWNELVTSDPVAALAFYGRQFGWQKSDVMSLGPLGNYQFMECGGTRFGAMMQRSRAGAAPLWRFYFGVDDIDRAARAISAGGGQLVGEPQPVPGGGFAIVALDPQGAEFGIAGPRRS